MIEVVAALIWNGGQFLICQRPPHKSRPMQWEFPGGKLEPGETPQQALVRECQEELAITIQVGEICGDLIYAYPDITIHLTLYHAAIAAGTPQMLEHQDLRWINRAELPRFRFCPADTELLPLI